MTAIRVVWGTGQGPTETAAYDAALVDAGVGDYNLVRVSSIVPADASITVAETAPALGPIGGQLTVVEARAVGAGPASVAAGLGWAVTDDGPGLIYEAAGESDPETIRDRIAVGLGAGLDLRPWADGSDPDRIETTADRADDGYVAAVVVAAYGRATPL